MQAWPVGSYAFTMLEVAPANTVLGIHHSFVCKLIGKAGQWGTGLEANVERADGSTCTYPLTGLTPAAESNWIVATILVTEAKEVRNSASSS